ncbi:MAG: hypothetical protein IJT54_05085 [Candidatus Methanomethylophilaceae archaeon]|nr:hypothetical protein [Candidatus Methanomethylophilaceae archaeon]
MENKVWTYKLCDTMTAWQIYLLMKEHSPIKIFIQTDVEKGLFIETKKELSEQMKMKWQGYIREVRE